LGTHEFVEKRDDSGAAVDNSALTDGDADSFVEHVRALRVTPVEVRAGSDSTIVVEQCNVATEVEVGANEPNDKPIEIVKPQKWTAVNARRESDSASVVGLRESDIVEVPRKSDNLSVDSVEEPSNATLDSGERDDTVIKLRPDSLAVDAVKESNTTTLDVTLELDNETVQLLRGTDSAREVIAADDAVETDLMASEYDMMDIDVPRPKSRAEMGARGIESTEAVNALYTMNPSPRSSGDLGSWQAVNRWTAMRQDGRQGQGSKSSTGIDPKELLDGWDWVFQRR
jgi:hypothetical protein